MRLFVTPAILRLLGAGLVVALTGSPTFAQDAGKAPTKDQIEFFESKVRPILEQHCIRCHGAKANPKGGLRLTNRDAVLKGGESGAAVTLEKPDESLLIQAINYSGYEMPPTGKLPKEQID